MPLFLNKSNRLPIEGEVGVSTEPRTFMSNDTVGEVATSLKQRKASLHGRPVDRDIGGAN